ncbi:hypothetical protein ABZ845_31450 [Streptomyces sp. NPDC047022]|uniref:hypothetical protein n=1 Tax=Streptomyces sp. NPDC047022 TaxID=3155737 RepID=UPI0033F8B203
MRYTTLSGIAALVTVLVNGVSAVPAVAGGSGSGIQVPCDTTALTTAIAGAPAGSTLVLARHCTYHLTTAYSGNDGLPPIDRQLTIRGQGATIVRDGTAGAFRIFHVASTGDLRLDDITIRGGNSSFDGGGILVDGMLKLSKATIDNNTSTTDGAGVDVETGATAYITRSEFTFNNSGGSGGGLQSNGTVTTDAVVFNRNFAATDGGAIGHDDGDAVYRNTTLKNNTSVIGGGGIQLFGGTAQFINSKILNNTTTGSEGGGIRNDASLTLIKTEVAGNVVGGSAGLGGGIFESGGTLVLRDSSVDRNSANGSGNSQAGGIFNAFGAATLDHSEVNNNASTVAPGGVWTNIQFTVSRSEIRNNIPTNCDGSPIIVTGCVG